MKHLYFIGNGFDLHHDFKTRYTDFRNWLKSYNPEAYNNLLSLYSIKDDNSNKTWDWWSCFEANLVDFDVYDDILDIARENQIDYASDSCDRMRSDGAVEAEIKFEDTMKAVLASFDEWVNSLGQLNSDKKIDLDRNADFITFNYTLTLEEKYGIPQSRVHHFHGKLGDDKYILGHGRTYSEIENNIRGNEPMPPSNISEEQLHDWHANQWDEAYENTLRSTASRLARYKKDVANVIQRNNKLYEKLDDLEKITIFGFSFSDIDNPYISYAIKKSKNKETLRFIVNWHSQNDLNNINSFFLKEGVKKSQIEMIKLDDITIEHKLSLF